MANLMIYQLKQDERFLRLPEVKHITALSRAHIYLLISKDEFPKQYKLGQRAAGWLESEVLAWMQSKITPTGSDHRSDAP
jgi:prophage regulatory protein|tara:strand:- start:56 stop:295 length:240 start_codon:yes stop_codon:yes gene_type:complete